MALPQGDEKQRMVRDMFDAIAPRYDLVNRVMTFRLDVRWRRRTVRELGLPAGSRVLDLAAGTGDLCRDLTVAGHRPIGVDLSFGMLAAARTSAPLVHADALHLPVPDGAADGATCGFALRNFVDLGAFLAELGRVVRPGGRIALLEVAEPENPVLRIGHGVYFGKVVPRIGGLLSDASAYRYLPKSVAYLPPTDRLMAMVREAGFPDARRHVLSGGISQLLVGTERVSAQARPAALVARTRRLDGDVDLLAVAGPEGVLFEQAGNGLAGRGEALRLPLPVGPGRLVEAAAEVQAALDAIHREDEVGLPGTGPVAFAALPFADSTPGSVVVPSLVVGRAEDGTRWVTTVGPPDTIGGAAELAAPATPPPGASSYTVRSSRTPEEWCGAVAAAVERLRAGELAKAVLAREVVVEADAPIDVVAVLRRLRSAYPSTMLYSIDGLVGATPELLVSRFGDVVRSHPFAGTTPRTGDPVADARAAAGLLASVKDRAEHRITIDMVLDTVLPFCSYVDSEPEPSIVSLANVQHLASLVEGRLSSPPATALALVAALHPTPAVGGWPAADALALIDELEELDRGRYTGAVGWVDADGDGRFGVAIRCAEIQGNRARLFAGNGIVADSDPETELAETRAKLQAMLGAVLRP